MSNNPDAKLYREVADRTGQRYETRERMHNAMVRAIMNCPVCQQLMNEYKVMVRKEPLPPAGLEIKNVWGTEDT